MVWKHRLYLLIFLLHLKYLGLLYREYIKTVKNGNFCEELLIENDFEAILVNFCCYDYGVNASEAVQKISTVTLELYANSLKHSCTYEKTYIAVYYLLTGDATQVFCFFLTKIKMSKQHRFNSYIYSIGCWINVNHYQSVHHQPFSLPVWE